MSARPLRAPCVELKYSSTVRPSRKLALIGVSMILPDGLAIRPRMPAELADLLDAAAGTGVGHQEDRVHVAAPSRTSFSSSLIISVVICSRACVQASSTWL